MKIIFAGTPEFGLPCLNAIWNSTHHLVAVYTQPDRRAGRGKKLHHSAIKEWAIIHSIPVYQPLNFKDDLSVQELIKLQPDLIVVIAYGLLLPMRVLTIPRYGCINVHASLLPRWRGASPIQQAILHGDLRTGITIMQMAAGLDTGPIAKQAAINIEPTDTALILHHKLAVLAVEPLLAIIDDLENITVEFTPQNDGMTTYAPKINKEDARLNWRASAILIERQIRAFLPWPVAHTYAGDELIRIHRAEVIELQKSKINAIPGTIITIDKYGMVVATMHGLLKITALQFASSKVLEIRDWFNSGKATPLIGALLQ
ncbi:MAG: methionyl-tRNA formyltransferase [Legionellales bacterium RIFCSPHIGHO2_12_FULL_35_11]|nr:MAG: methionyl-tRNA formyltransferase [Legionellales bacterium RIFCSPHIGHO2_12_FULL_35_11]